LTILKHPVRSAEEILNLASMIIYIASTNQRLKIDNSKFSIRNNYKVRKINTTGHPFLAYKVFTFMAAGTKDGFFTEINTAIL
jgi:hypothetical protein